jgi:hypothetical protein
MQKPAVDPEKSPSHGLKFVATKHSKALHPQSLRFKSAKGCTMHTVGSSLPKFRMQWPARWLIVGVARWEGRFRGNVAIFKKTQIVCVCANLLKLWELSYTEFQENALGYIDYQNVFKNHTKICRLEIPKHSKENISIVSTVVDVHAANYLHIELKMFIQCSIKIKHELTRVTKQNKSSAESKLHPHLSNSLEL